MSSKILIIAGDPNSINSEIIYKSWKRLNNNVRSNIYLIANYNLINQQLQKLKYSLRLTKFDELESKNKSNCLKVIDVDLNFSNPFNVSLKNASTYVINCLNLAHKLMSEKKYKGVINCPINKRLLGATSILGVTEFLASKCKIKDNSEVMMISNKNLSVAPLTTHLNVKNISKNISSNLIIKKITTINVEYKKIYRKLPKIGVLGLNPHNAELKKNSEEYQKIIPALSKLKKKKINVHGPLVSDTVFISNYKKYDVIVGMYHDQVLSPFKALFKFNAINITLGLTYMRVSPDHGPALDIVGKKKSNCFSLLQCIKFINTLKQ